MKYAPIFIGISLLITAVILLSLSHSRGESEGGQPVGLKSQVDYSGPGHSTSDIAIKVSPTSAGGLPRALVLGSYLQAILTDDADSQTRTLKVISETKGDSFFQYEVQSTEGEVGIITLGIDRVFGFLPTKEGIYEYAGSSLDLEFEKSVMDKFEGDIYPSILKERSQ